ncbi:multi-tm2 domain protein [Paenibacillus sp. P13VS]|uniref:multi-tm2 domain protein n=1 Tax=Paenibacillus sp. P13VS TaxID=2697367 RepID=UPI00187B85B1|nr:multi-tm2 domain protein [Paenibacillus sp. P13VS]MBE7682436.1 multi-tm2 domain protein [Paenibacillus sp. P13VS]
MTTVQSDRNKIFAFLLNVIPGLGFLYWGRTAKAMIYPLIVFGSLIGAFMLAVIGDERDLMIFGALAAFFFWCINMLDIIIVLLRTPSARNAHYRGYEAQYGPYPGSPYEQGYPDPNGVMEPMNGEEIRQHSANGYGIPEGTYGQPVYRKGSEGERFFTILLSFIPGLGHLHLGLLHRGLSFLIAFFGSFAMMVFVASITNEETFLMFLLILPVIWVYCMFDAVQHVHRKQAGEVLQDRTLFEELEMGRASGRRSKVLATLLSAFPGAGHLYLGLQKRGMQLMFLFLGSIYILDLLHLSVFLFMIPLVWFYSFFDGLQCSSRYGREPLTDQPIFKDWARHQRLIGFGIAALGVYYLAIRLVIPQLNEMFPNLFMTYEIRSYVNTVIVSLLLIFGGLKLLFGKQRAIAQHSGLHGKEDDSSNLVLFKDRDN